MYTEDLLVQWAHEPNSNGIIWRVSNNNTPSSTVWAKAMKLWHACFQDFTKVVVYLVIQVDLSKTKVVRCEQHTCHWALDQGWGQVLWYLYLSTLSTLCLVLVPKYFFSNNLLHLYLKSGRYIEVLTVFQSTAKLHVAREVLSSVEHLFSIAGEDFTPQRCRLTGSQFEQLVFVRVQQ